MNREVHNIATILMKYLKDHLETGVEYCHHPIVVQFGDSYFTGLTREGRRFKVTVHEVSLEEEIDKANAQLGLKRIQVERTEAAST